MTDLSPMPCFGSPPVVETVMGVFFQPLSGFNVAVRAEFWAKLKNRFPNVEERGPIDEVREEFGKEVRTGPEIRWQVVNALPSPRLWAKSPDGKHTIQIQHNALIVNWERDPDSVSYIPYAQRRSDFADQLEVLRQFLDDARIGKFVLTTSFVKYINHIEYSEPSEFAPLLEKTLAGWKNESSDGWLPEVERARLELAFPMPDEQGRLHVSLRPAVRHKDKKRLIRLDLTARCTANHNSVEETLKLIDLEHEWVVRGFTSLTSPEMHKKWERMP